MDSPSYKISTHERCGDPCPQIRDRIERHPDFEFIGLWGPFVESADSEETLAEGHEEVEEFLDEHLSEE